MKMLMLVTHKYWEYKFYPLKNIHTKIAIVLS